MQIKSSVLIIVSRLDMAGMNMRGVLIERLGLTDEEVVDVPSDWPEGAYTILRKDEIALFTIPGSHIRIDYMKDHIVCDLIIFASKHASATGRKTLLAHPLGNWGEDTIGSGVSFSLGIAPPHVLHHALMLINKYRDELGLTNYWTGYEVTHHGPTELPAPAIFMETGGSEEEWGDEVATRAVALAIADLANDYRDMELPSEVYIGVGGGHYAPTFIRKSVGQGLMFGHMIPKHHIPGISEDMLKKAAESTVGRKKIFYIDRKGMKGADRRRIIEILEKLGLEYRQTKR